MRILRLAASDEDQGRIAPGSLAHEVAAAILHQATGEVVETTIRNLWPDDGLPELVERWMVRYEPDLVLLKVNAFWFNYLSVPLRLERRLGRPGAYIGRAGVRAGETRLVARSPVFHLARRYLLRTIGGATYFTPEQVVASMRDCVQRILAHEGVGLVVVGPHSRMNHDLTRKAAAAHERRRQHVHRAMKQLCSELHVPFLGQDTLPTRDQVAAMVGADGIHMNAEAARRGGEEEAVAFLQVWQHSPREAVS